jgi:hypothetical protein
VLVVEFVLAKEFVLVAASELVEEFELEIEKVLACLFE